MAKTTSRTPAAQAEFDEKIRKARDRSKAKQNAQRAQFLAATAAGQPPQWAAPAVLPNEQRPQALATAPPFEKLLYSHDDLRAAGILYSKAQLFRLMGRGLFPRPIKIDSRNAWVASEVQAWLEARMAERAA